MRPVYVRVEADNNPTYNVYVSAYKNNDDVVIVAVNRSTVSKTLTFSIPGTKVETWEKYVTSGTKHLAKESNVNSTSGSFLITLDPQSTTTFVGKASKTSTSGSPSISITSPTSGASFSNTSIVNLTVTATDADGLVAKVKFYNGSTKS